MYGYDDGLERAFKRSILNNELKRNVMLLRRAILTALLYYWQFEIDLVYPDLSVLICAFIPDIRTLDFHRAIETKTANVKT